MQVKSIAEVEHSAVLSTFIKLPFVFKIFISSIFEWLFYTGFTVFVSICIQLHMVEGFQSFNQQ